MNTCELCGLEKTLYLSINKQWVCNPCSSIPANKWVGENHWKFADGSKLKVSHGAAKAIHLVHGALNDENKKKFADMLTTPKGFEKAAHFALSKVEYKIGDK